MAIVGHRVTGLFLPSSFRRPPLARRRLRRPLRGAHRRLRSRSTTTATPFPSVVSADRRDDRASGGWHCTDRAAAHHRQPPRKWSRRAPCPRRHVRSLDTRRDRRQPTSCRYAHPELPGEGGRDGEKRCGANHGGSVGSGSRARARRADLAHAEPDDHSPGQSSPAELRAVRGVRRRRRRRHHPDRREDSACGTDGSRGRAIRPTRSPLWTRDSVRSARRRAGPCADHRVVPAAGRWRPDHGHRDRAHRPAVGRRRRRHARERRRRPARARAEHPVHLRGLRGQRRRPERVQPHRARRRRRAPEEPPRRPVADAARVGELLERVHARPPSGHDAPLRGLHQGPERPERTFLRRPATRGAEGNGPDVERGAARPPDRASRTRRRRHRHRRPPPPTAGTLRRPHHRERDQGLVRGVAAARSTVGSSTRATRPGPSRSAPCRAPRHRRARTRRSSNTTRTESWTTTSRSSSAGCGTTAGSSAPTTGVPTGRDRGLVCVLTRSSGRSSAPDDFFVASLGEGTRERASDGPRPAARPRTHRPAGTRATTSTGSSTCSRTNARTRSVSATSTARSRRRRVSNSNGSRARIPLRSSPSRTSTREQPCAKPARRTRSTPGW